MSGRDRTVRVFFVGGPMYDGLYGGLPEFEKQTGFKVEIVAKLPHPELNARVKRDFTAGGADIDLISTHTKYAPSQVQWLEPLDGLLAAKEAEDLLPKPAELARIEGRLVQIPRNLDCRLLYYRRKDFDDPKAKVAFEATFRKPLAVPETWDDLVEVSTFLTRPGCHGFLFPGRDSGLFGIFYELLVGAGGDLFDPDLNPAFDSPAGMWAVDRLAELHHRRRTTPRQLPEWHYDEVSASFRRGEAAMVSDWPGSHYLYRDPSTCTGAEDLGIALLPRGFSGRRAAYAGCHSFAIVRGTRNRDGALALLHFLTSTASQLGEARRGAIPVRTSALEAIRREVASDPVESPRWELLARTMSEAVIIPPRFAAYPACEDALWKAIQKGMEGTLSPAEAVREAATEVSAVVRAFRASPRG